MLAVAGLTNNDESDSSSKEFSDSLNDEFVVDDDVFVVLHDVDAITLVLFCKLSLLLLLFVLFLCIAAAPIPTGFVFAFLLLCILR